METSSLKKGHLRGDLKAGRCSLWGRAAGMAGVGALRQEELGLGKD